MKTYVNESCSWQKDSLCKDVNYFKLINKFNEIPIKAQQDNLTCQIASTQNRMSSLKSNGGDKYASGLRSLFSLVQSNPKIYMNEQREET